ncbi:ammonium transporter [Sphingomonas flavalba]|uniref:ammonium transporter n=1 Tax=Sphingomonas flavalba TaxID=2559804 RepID=UPI00109DD167|nr:ammonium transporter [Sphingomonas flavalba]
MRFRYKYITAFTVLSLATLPAPAAAWVAAAVDKGDTAWMMTATVLVLLMIVPGLALFYGGLVRTKNMLSMLTQVLGVCALAMLVWVGWGYSLAFSGGGPFIGDGAKLFLAGVTPETLAETFTAGVAIPEYVFVSFQMTFAAITAALVLGGLAERLKFAAALLFAAIWLTIVYFPIAHMVWAAGGYLFEMGALDFAGGTVVHINAGVAALVGALMLGRRTGYQRDVMAPHSLVMTLIGAGLLWVGWFGFNAGSALEANGAAALAMVNTFVATAAGVLAWMLAEKVAGYKCSLLGAASGAIAGLVAVTPAAGNSGPLGAILLGAIASGGCFWFVTMLKPRLRLDDSLDAFGIHGIGGIIGSLGTAIVYAPALGGPGAADYAVAPQLATQAVAVAVAVLWSGIGSAVAFGIVKVTIGLRVSEDVEREGLDLGEHGERAYNY